MTVIFEAEGITKCVYDAAKKTVNVKWYSLGGHDQLRPCLQAQMDAVKKGAEFIVVDVSESTGTPSQEDQAYFGDTLFPFFNTNGLRALITVLPTGAISKMGAKRWQKTASNFNFETYDVDAVKDAESLVSDLRSGKAA